MLARARRAVAAVAHIGQEDVGTGHRAADHLGGVGRLDRDHVGAAFGQHRRRWRRRGLLSTTAACPVPACTVRELARYDATGRAQRPAEPVPALRAREAAGD